MKPPISCPTDLLPIFLDGQLNDEQLSSIELHLEVCDQCCNELELQSGKNDFWSSLVGLSDDQWDRDWSSFDGTYGESMTPCSGGTSVKQVPKFQAALDSVKGILAPSDDPKSVGRIGRYEVLGLVGRGGMGIVFKVRDPSLDRVVALKILAPHLSAYESTRIRFQREAKAAAAVKHDGIIPIFGVDVHQGTPYFVMPYEGGPSLQQRINSGGKLSIEESLRVAMQIADALAAAHQSGLVHRDIKPSNILLAPGTERALLMDFGLAQVASGQSITETGMLTGTPAFMSPEQARGEIVDSRSDLFSLGSVMFMMLTGRPPVDGSSAYAVVRSVGGEIMPRVSDFEPTVPTWLDNLVARLHASEVESRIQTADEAKTLLADCLAVVQNPDENRVPVSLTASHSKHRSPFLWQWSLGSVSVVAAIWVFSTLGPFAHRYAGPENSKSPSHVAENPTLKWDDGLDESVDNIRLRLKALEVSENWFDGSSE